MPNHSETQEKVQDPAAESCTTILFQKISALLKTITLTSSTIINKFLGLSIIFPNIEKQIRNLNTQNMISLLKKPLDLASYLQLWQKISTLYVSLHLLVKYMLKSAYKNVFYLSLNHMIMDLCTGLI